MMEWLLSYNNLFHATTFGSIVFMILFIIIQRFIPYEENSKKYELIDSICVTATIIVPMVILFCGAYIKSQIHLEYTSDIEWKTIYTNNIDADVILNLKNNEGESISNVKAGASIGDDYKKYNSSMDGEILAKKGESEEKKTIHIDKSNIIHEGELTPTSKITKIEYRPAQHIYNSAFGYKGKPSKKANKDGLVRITISEDTNSERTELKKLFE